MENKKTEKCRCDRCRTTFFYHDEKEIRIKCRRCKEENIIPIDTLTEKFEK